MNQLRCIGNTEYLELCCISPDWKISKDEKLKQILAEMLADFLEVEHGKEKPLYNSFCWVTDDIAHMHLWVRWSAISEEYRADDKFMQSVLDYALGLSTGMGFVE